MHDREDAAIAIRPEALADAPELVVETMAEATQRLREQGWMIAPMTTTVSPGGGRALEPRRPRRWLISRRRAGSRER